MKDYCAEIFSERLKDLRAERNIGQNKLAHDLGFSNAGVSYWENGKREPSAFVLFKLAQYFNVTVDYLVGLE